MSAHTPGPWHVSKDQPIVFDADNRVVADCSQHDGSSYAERYANASLIADAPDLLDALQWMVANWQDLPAGMNRAEDVIRKAERAIDALNRLFYRG
jgi:hypothetical protein